MQHVYIWRLQLHLGNFIDVCIDKHRVRHGYSKLLNTKIEMSCLVA